MQDSLLKQCTKCGEFKSLDCFSKRLGVSCGLRSQCKDCDREVKQKWDAKNKQHCLNYSRQYRQQNKNKIKQYQKEYYLENQAQCKDYSKKYKQNNKNVVRKQYQQNFYYYKVLYAFNALFKDKIQTSEIFKSLSYTVEELQHHFEYQFTPEMNWDNYGTYWELDHIIPQNLFNLSDIHSRDFQVCWSLANLRPLTVKENRLRPKDGSDISEELKSKILKINY